MKASNHKTFKKGIMVLEVPNKDISQSLQIKIKA